MITMKGVAHIPTPGDNSDNWELPARADGRRPLLLDFSMSPIGDVSLTRDDAGVIHAEAQWLARYELATAWLGSHRYFALGILRPSRADARVVSCALARENVDPRIAPFEVEWGEPW